MALVKHMKNTSDREPEDYDAWLKYWDDNCFFGIPDICPVCGGSMSDPVGAHVVRVDIDSKETFITPTCRSCNSKRSEEPFTVSSIYLVPANKNNLPNS